MQSLLPSAATHTAGLLSHPHCSQLCSALLFSAPPLSPHPPIAPLQPSRTLQGRRGAVLAALGGTHDVQPHILQRSTLRDSFQTGDTEWVGAVGCREGAVAAPVGAGKQSPNSVRVQQKRREEPTLWHNRWSAERGGTTVT